MWYRDEKSEFLQIGQFSLFHGWWLAHHIEKVLSLWRLRWSQWTSSWVIMTNNIMSNYDQWYHIQCMSNIVVPSSLLSDEREGNMVRHVWLGAKTLMPGLVFIYMHQIHSSIYAPSVDGWGDYVCIRRSLACLQGAIWGRLYRVCTWSGPRFDVLAMKLLSFQLKTFTDLLKWFNQCIKSWGIWITHLHQLQTSSCTI